MKLRIVFQAKKNINCLPKINPVNQKLNPILRKKFLTWNTLPYPPFPKTLSSSKQ